MRLARGMKDDKRHRRSLLQLRILLQLDREPSGTISGLADKLRVYRSSASRSLHSLERNGLVQHGDGLWCITAPGRREMIFAYSEMLKEAMNQIGRFIAFVELEEGEIKRGIE